MKRSLSGTILVLAVASVCAAPASAQIAFTGGGGGSGGGGSTPSGTGFVHVVGGVQDGASKAVDLSGADATGILAAGRFPALTGDTTTSSGALATTVVSLTGTSGVVNWPKAQATPGFSQPAQTTDVATNDITIAPQPSWASATGTNKIGGNFDINLATPTNSGTVESQTRFERGGTVYGAIQPLSGTATSFAIYSGGTPQTSPSSTNYSFSTANNGGGTTINSSAGATTVKSANNVIISAGAAQTIQLDGAQLVRVRAVVNHAASPYAVALGDYIIPVDPTAGVVTTTLPVPVAGRSLIVKDSTCKAATNNITVAQHAAETIDGAASVVMTKNCDALWITTDGTNWMVIGEFSSSIVP